MYNLSNQNREEFLTPFEYLFNELLASQNKQLAEEIGDDFYKGAYPKIDVIEYDDKLVLEADVGGLSKNEVSAEIDGDFLVISGGSKIRDIPNKEARYVYREIKRSSFQRSFRLGENIDRSKVKAEFKNGSLFVELPRRKVEEKPTRVKLL